MTGEWRSILHPQDAPAYLAEFGKAVLDRSYFKRRVRIRNREGEWRWIKTYAMPWFTAPGEYAGYVGISLDITETVNGETALLEANRRKDEFLATLAHELRNPLAPIVNALTLDCPARRRQLRSATVAHHQPSGQLHGSSGR